MVYDNADEFVSAMVKRRKTDKDKWIFFEGIVAGKLVYLKFYNTYIR